MDEIRLWVQQHDFYGIGVENFEHLLSNKLCHGVHIQSFHHGFTDTVEDVKFCSALLGFLKEALSLIEEACVVDGGRGLSGKRHGKLSIMLVVKTRLLHIQGDHANKILVVDDGHSQVTADRGRGVRPGAEILGITL